jgi:hypothetical protein
MQLRSYNSLESRREPPICICESEIRGLSTKRVGGEATHKCAARTYLVPIHERRVACSKAVRVAYKSLTQVSLTNVKQ